MTMIGRLKVIGTLLAAMISVFVVDLLLGGFLKSFGINPRNIESIYTVFTAPWLHGNITHLGSNMIGFVVFSFLCLLNGLRYFVKASFFIIVLSGLLVWLFGREATHIGASGWIFGLWSLTIALAWFERSYRNILISLGVIFFYGGMAFGMLPTDKFISFESHAFGALAGIFSAWFLTKKKTLEIESRRDVQVEPGREGDMKFWS